MKSKNVRPKTKAQKVERARTIGESASIFIGRMMERLKRAVGESPDSDLETRAGLPVSLRRRAALRFRMTTP